MPGSLLLKWFFWGVCLWGMVPELNAQSKKAQEGYEGALLLYKRKHYTEALQVLEKAATFSAMPEIWFLKADIYNKLKNPESEIEAIEQGLAIDSVKYTGYYYFLAENYLARGDYDRARRTYTAYLEKDKKQHHGVRARRQLRNCEFAIEALRTQQKQPAELYLTSAADIYWPSLDVRGKTVLYTEQKEGVENIRMREGEKAYWLNINTGNNEGTQSLTADGQMMYFTGCGRPDSRGSCDIYVAYRISDTLWSEPVNLGEPVNTDAWEAQPAVSADGRKLFFASNRPGGRGGSDIWYSTLLRREENGRQIWSQPKLLYFNTPGQEMAPYLYYDNRILFFASDGYPGMGEMDIYRVDLESIDTPVNIGITVNSYKDELGFAVDASGKTGYFSSDKNGRKEIFKYALEDEMQCPGISYVRFVVKDEEGNRILPEQLVVVLPEKGDTLAYYSDVYRPETLLACIPAGKSVLVSVLKPGYLYYSDTLSVDEYRQGDPGEYEIILRRIRENASFVLRGVFFEVDDYNLRPESLPELNQLMAFLKWNPEVKIEIAGHTDDTGTDEYNDRLSENRAFEVYKYLFLHRIPKERMSYKGYGKRQPAVSNATEAGKAANRRTEIRIKGEN